MLICRIEEEYNYIIVIYTQTKNSVFTLGLFYTISKFPVVDLQNIRRRSHLIPHTFRSHYYFRGKYVWIYHVCLFQLLITPVLFWNQCYSIRRLLATPHSDNLLQIDDGDLFKINKEKFNMKAYDYVAKHDSKIVANDKES